MPALAASFHYDQSRALLQQRPNDFVRQIRNVSEPLHLEQDGAERMSKSWGPTPRIVQEHPAPQDVPSMKKQVRLALVSDYGNLKSAHKEIARDAGCSPRTVESWMEERSLPSFEYIVRLGKRSPAIQQMAMQLMALDPDLDPKAYSMFLEFMRMVRR